ncbi:MAG: FAD:protein FMN transferase [Burkholderiaceae bacterium]
MASHCEVRIYAPDEATARGWADAAIAEVRRIETKYSRYRDDSVTTAINRAAGGTAINVDSETAGLLDFAAELHAQSDGAFDLTSGVLRRAWDFRAGRVPSQAALDQLLQLVGWSQVEWRSPTLQMRAGMEIDFGGIGKEYAADRAAAIVAELGGEHGLVNLGGDVRVIGPHADGQPWRVAVQDPRGEPGTTIAYLSVPHGAMATSGDYERFFMHEGRRYSHVLDPRTGWPVEHWRSVSVVAPLAIAAGACATVAMLKTVDDGLKFLAGQGVRYLAIDSGGERYST